MMDARCIVNAGEFQKALEKVLKVAPKKCSIPALMEVLVRFDGDACTLTCTDLELWCQASIPAEGGSCAFVLTGSRRLLTACKFLSGELEFSYRKGQPPEHAPTKTDLDGDLWISCGGKEICQRVTAAEEFPDLPDVEAEHTYTVQTASLRKRFERIKYALSDDSVRPCNRCVKFFDNRIGAVDGYRLAMNRDEALCVDAPFHIPPGAMRLLPVFEGTDCQLLVGKRRAAFDSGDIRIITKLPEGESLDFDAAIPRHYPEGYTVNIPFYILLCQQHFSAAVDRLSIDKLCEVPGLLFVIFKAVTAIDPAIVRKIDIPFHDGSPISSPEPPSGDHPVLQSEISPEAPVKDKLPSGFRVNFPAPVLNQVFIPPPAAVRFFLCAHKGPEIVLLRPGRKIRVLRHFRIPVIQRLLLILGGGAATAFVDGENISAQIKQRGVFHAQRRRLLRWIAESFRCKKFQIEAIAPHRKNPPGSAQPWVKLCFPKPPKQLQRDRPLLRQFLELIQCHTRIPFRIVASQSVSNFPAEVQNDSGRKPPEFLPLIRRKGLIHLTDDICRNSVQPYPALFVLKRRTDLILPRQLFAGADHMQALVPHCLTALQKRHCHAENPISSRRIAKGFSPSGEKLP